jgi:putative membrane protein
MRHRCDQTAPWTIVGGGAMYGQHYGWMNDMMGWGTWMVPWGWIIIVVLVVILFFALGGRAGQRPSGSGGSSAGEKWDAETPMDILKKRYARGEISREDFEQMKKDLSS